MSHSIDSTRRYVESFLAALKDCGHALENVRTVLSEMVGPEAAERPTQEPQPAAFPSDYIVDGHRYVNEGLTFRDYFAAHAPAEPQSWFDPVMPHPRPAAPPPIRPETDDEKEDWSAYMEDMILVEQVRSPRLAGLIRESNFHRQQLRDWQADYAKQTRIQWPWAWADVMLRARSGT